jgi:uncharacterized protein
MSADKVQQLCDACHRGDLEAATALLDGPQPPHPSVGGGSSGRTPLMDASFNGHKDVVKMLLDRGADIHVRCKLGYTALIWAAQRGFQEIVVLFLDRGADVNAQNQHGLVSGTCSLGGG